jgi:hypothetical protein
MNTEACCVVVGPDGEINESVCRADSTNLGEVSTVVRYAVVEMELRRVLHKVPAGGIDALLRRVLHKD